MKTMEALNKIAQSFNFTTEELATMDKVHKKLFDKIQKQSAKGHVLSTYDVSNCISATMDLMGDDTINRGEYIDQVKCCFACSRVGVQIW